MEEHEKTGVSVQGKLFLVYKTYISESAEDNLEGVQMAYAIQYIAMHNDIWWET